MIICVVNENNSTPRSRIDFKLGWDGEQRTQVVERDNEGFSDIFVFQTKIPVEWSFPLRTLQLFYLLQGCFLWKQVYPLSLQIIVESQKREELDQMDSVSEKEFR